MKKIFIVICLILSLILSSCFFLRVGIRSLGDTFSSPDKIENKVKNPIKDSVKLSVLWIGHSSELVQIYDRVIIMDPLFNTRVGGLLMRKKEPGLDFSDVRKLNLILVSHAHMDHMSLGSLEMIADKFPGCPMLFPKGDENYLPNFDLNMMMVATGDSVSNYIGTPVYVDSMKITPVYAYHPGGRYLIDSYTWKIKGATGYIIQYKDVCIYFAGDTGYNEYAFKNIGNMFKIDLAFIPIGPCRNCDSAGIRYHASSVEALQIFEDLKAEYMIPIHYGALSYFSEPNRPKDYLEQIVDDPESHYHFFKDRIKILTEGEQIVWREK